MSDEESHWSWVALEEAEFEIARLRTQVAELREALNGVRFRAPRGRETLWRLDTDLMPSEWEKHRIAALEMSGGVK